MSADELLLPERESHNPTPVRYAVLAASTAMAVLLYLDRYAVSIPLESIREDLRMTQGQKASFISAFFYAYAFCQVPAGWLSDRFGPRMMLTVYMLCWSVVTGLMGVTHAIWIMLWLRVICGAAQAGAYPTAGGLVRHWYPVSVRGTASSIVGLGGRFGGVLAQFVTAVLIVYFVSAKPAPRLTTADILNDDAFIARFDPVQKAVPDTPIELSRREFVTSLFQVLPESDRGAFTSFSNDAKERLLHAKKPNSSFRFQDWIPNITDLTGPGARSSPEGVETIVQSLSKQMETENFYEFANRGTEIPLKLPGDAQSLLDQQNRGTRLSELETILLNRYVLETLFPTEVLKSRGQGWRQTLILYGFIGIVIAFLFALVVRNNPQKHPWCNAAEVSFINDEASQRQAALEPKNPPFPWRALLSDVSLWGNSSCQFLTNVGWLFTATTLPQYLQEVHDVPIVTKGLMTAFPMGAGILGLFSGGRATDWAVRRLGLKWGRRLPLVGSRFTAAAGYALCLLLSVMVVPDSENHAWLPWLYVGGLCLAAASTDFGTPALWAYCQDVGGKYTASILGWGNMWGNLGAAIAPFIYVRCLGDTPSVANWNTVFAVCCGVFVVSGFCGMLLDATRPLTVERVPVSST